MVGNKKNRIFVFTKTKTMNNKFTTLTIAISLLVLLIGCENNFVDSDNNGIVDPVPVVIKKKHMENSVTKDIAYGAAPGHYVSMPIEKDSDYDYQLIILDALKNMWVNPGKKALLNLFNRDPVSFAARMAAPWAA